MNDDIAARNAELIAAILNALNKKLDVNHTEPIRKIDPTDEDIDSINIVIVEDLLDEQGFDATSSEHPKQEE